jgi:integrase
VPAIRIKAAIIDDNTGVKSKIPILLTEDGDIPALTDYLLELDTNGYSASKIYNVVRACGLLIDYLEANQDCYDDPQQLFQGFARRLYSGTVGEDGLDPSGLYWIPASTDTVNRIIGALTGFTDWLADKQGIAPLNPLRTASSHEQRLNYAAWHRKNQNDFLGHIRDKSIGKVAKKVRTLRGRSKQTPADDSAIAFPEDKWIEFLRDGVGGAKDPRVRLRDQLICILMHGGGLRLSEAMTLWVFDVLEDPKDPNSAIVRIYDEEDGRAPENWRGRNGDTTRKAYMREKHSRNPRKKEMGTARVGWKTRAPDHKDQYLQVQWFQKEYGQIFMLLWRQYLMFRAATDCFHPYAFISFSTRFIGNPYTINAFNKNYDASLRRIGLEPNKDLGLSPHGHRHNYGRRLEMAGVSPLVIKKCLHHKSLESQAVYTAKSQEEISRCLSEATAQLDAPTSKVKPLAWAELIEHGFEGIDPQGLLSGKAPRLLRNK